MAHLPLGRYAVIVVKYSSHLTHFRGLALQIGEELWVVESSEHLESVLQIR